LSLFAIKEMIRGRDLNHIIDELTNGRSTRSKKISKLLEGVTLNPTTDFDQILSIFNHGPLWREVQYLMSR
jgi:hypothetical protein